MPYETVIYEKKGRIGYITMNRPQALNALSRQLMRELGEIWQDFRDDDNLWIAIITGAGDRAFCAGADVKEVPGREEETRDGGVMPESREPYRPGLYNVAKPIICAVNGICAGGGLDFITETDIAICSENAEFMDPHVTIGLVSAHEMIQLSKRIPWGVAMRMGLMGRQERMSAQRAYDVGLMTEVVPLSSLLSRATEIAESVLENAPMAVRGTKACIRKGLDLPLLEASILGDYIRRDNVGTEDSIEGPRAFAEKRRPVWKAR